MIARTMPTLAITRVGRHFGVSERRPFRPDLWSRNQVSHSSASAGWVAHSRVYPKASAGSRPAGGDRTECRPTLALQADALRSSGLVISGSGAATMPVEKIISELPTFQSWAGGDLQVEVEEIPLADVAAAWLRPNNGRRIVLRV